MCIRDSAYADLNGDNMINDNDVTDLGQSFPTTTMGIDLSLNYKGFGLYILGTATTGVTNILSSCLLYTSHILSLLGKEYDEVID